MFISQAFAQSAGGAGGSSGMEMLILFVPIILIMYFLIIRPQRQQMKKRQEMLSSIHRNDTVVTGGGIVGKVTKVFDESGELEVEISDGVKIRVLRATVADVRRVESSAPKTSPATTKNTKKPSPRAKKQAETSQTADAETKTTKAKK